MCGWGWDNRSGHLYGRRRKTKLYEENCGAETHLVLLAWTASPPQHRHTPICKWENSNWDRTNGHTLIKGDICCCPNILHLFLTFPAISFSDYSLYARTYTVCVLKIQHAKNWGTTTRNIYNRREKELNGGAWLRNRTHSFTLRRTLVGGWLVDI